MTHDDKGRISQLDGLRGYAALVVVVFHAILSLDHTQIDRLLYTGITRIDGAYDRFNKIVLMLFNGELAVAIFFVLSGTVLFESFRRDTEPMASASVRFLVRRFFRIYPALFVCLMVALGVFLLLGKAITFGAVIQNLLLYDFPLNGPTWTLQVEFIGAALLLLMFVGYRVAGEVCMLVVGFALIALVHTPLFAGSPLKIFWLCFVLGAAIPTRIGGMLTELLPKWSWGLALVAMIVLRSDLQRVAAAILVGLLYYRKAGWLGEFLSRPISLFFGRMSYSLYLYNPIVLLLFEPLAAYAWANRHPVEIGLPFSVVMIVLTLPLAYLSKVVIENPFIDLGRSLTSRDRRSDTGATRAEVAN